MITRRCFHQIGLLIFIVASNSVLAGGASDSDKPDDASVAAERSVENEPQPELIAEMLAQIDAMMSMDADPDYGEYLANECTSCHSPKADTDAVPNIYGVPKEQIVSNLLQYREGIRTNTTMAGVAGALSNDDIAALATYLSAYTP